MRGNLGDGSDGGLAGSDLWSDVSDARWSFTLAV